MTINEILLKAFRESGKTAYLLADEAGVNRAYVYRWARGDANLGLDIAEKLAAALGVSWDKLAKTGRPG